MRVLQYGVTRDRLRDVLEEAEGWDVIHISGHGAPGELLLETAAGQPDRVTAGGPGGPARPGPRARQARHRRGLLVGRPHRRRAAPPARPARAGRPRPSRSRTNAAGSPSPPSATASGTLATELAERLGCAVLAMRYPVDDEFAIALSEKLYDLLAAKGQPLPRAVGMTLRQLAGRAGPAFPALSVATPALFGGDGRGPVARRPGARPEPVDYDTRSALKMAGFPPQPDRFVGRTGVMARASAALAAAQRRPRRAAARHARRRQDRVRAGARLRPRARLRPPRLVQGPRRGHGRSTGALTDFALTLERYLHGFQMAHLRRQRRQAGRVPAPAHRADGARRLLIVIDNAESLLTESGQWRDDRWGQVIGALTAHTAGLGRVIADQPPACPPRRATPPAAGRGGGRAVGRRGAAAGPRAPAPARAHLRRPARPRPGGVTAARARRAERRPGAPEAAGARRRAGRAPGPARRARGGRRPGVAGAGRPAGRVLRRSAARPRTPARRRRTTGTCSPPGPGRSPTR